MSFIKMVHGPYRLTTYPATQPPPHPTPIRLLLQLRPALPMPRWYIWEHDGTYHEQVLRYLWQRRDLPPRVGVEDRHQMPCGLLLQI